MRLSSFPGVHLTYCTNIHPGESLVEVRRNLETYLPRVRARVAPGKSMGVGLRLGALAARELLAAPELLPQLRAWLSEQQFYVFTLNGFPYGPFHGEPVKERVYLPDWRSPERLAYTQELVRILAELLPAGMTGSISTVPIAFKPGFEPARDCTAVVEHLQRAVAELFRLHAERGQTLVLALEPEPECVLETTADALAFLCDTMFNRANVLRFARLSGLAASEAEAVLRRHLGLCLDACHMAVEWEDGAASLAALQSAGVTLGKVQLSAGLEVDFAQAAGEKRRALATFADGVYLHQAVRRGAAGLTRFLDLPEVLRTEILPEHTLRVHFHVPIHHAELGLFRSTQPHLVGLLRALRGMALTQQLEVETYTWDVLPTELRKSSVDEAIASELSWVVKELG